MIIKEFGNKEKPTIILLHGGGLSWWSLEKNIKLLESKYHVVTPIIDGHGEDGNTTFTTIEDMATKLVNYIDTELGKKVFLLGGLSLGAQIVIEVLSRRDDICDHAIIESGLIYKIPGTKLLTAPTYKLCYGLIKYKWFSKMQSKALGLPDYLFDRYYDDSLKMSKETLVNFTISNGTYVVKKDIVNTKSNVLILVGKKELSIMKKSAKTLHDFIKNSKLMILENMKHGDISINYPDKFVEIINDLTTKIPQ